MINHHRPIPWVHLPADRITSPNDYAHILDVPFVNNISEVLLLVVEEDEWQA